MTQTQTPEMREAIARPPIEHELKTWPGPFQAVKSGVKPFEYRRCTDRDYREGDTLWLREWDPESQQFTGDDLRRLVTFVLPGGQFGVPEDCCVMGIPEALSTPSPVEGGGEPTREEIGKAIYLAMYEHQGGLWHANDSKETWFKIADRFLARTKPPSSSPPQATNSEVEWNDISTAPKSGQIINVRSVTSYKWTPYKPDGRRQMGVAGRWQRAGSYAGWDNANLPENGEWTPNRPLAQQGEKT